MEKIRNDELLADYKEDLVNLEIMLDTAKDFLAKGELAIAIAGLNETFSAMQPLEQKSRSTPEIYPVICSKLLKLSLECIYYKGLILWCNKQYSKALEELEVIDEDDEATMPKAQILKALCLASTEKPLPCYEKMKILEKGYDNLFQELMIFEQIMVAQAYCTFSECVRFIEGDIYKAHRILKDALSAMSYSEDASAIIKSTLSHYQEPLFGKLKYV